MNRIQFDGAAIPNPGRMGIGAVLLQDDRIVDQISRELPGVGTNNTAEYSALLAGLDRARELGWRQVAIEGDSKLVVNQVSGRWRINHEHLKKLQATVLERLSGFDSYQIKWVPREKNALADELASQILGHQEDPYHRGPVVGRPAAGAGGPGAAGKAEGDKCPQCGAACTFQWQVFKNGSRHIRQQCPEHGFIRFAPREEPFLTLSGWRETEVKGKKPQFG
ncbi:MAG: ribonuclease HI family protein [Methanosarcinales archaeon]|nr:ribonuclease HI family protein [Methanosarcinales archaeon]